MVFHSCSTHFDLIRLQQLPFCFSRLSTLSLSVLHVYDIISDILKLPWSFLICTHHYTIYSFIYLLHFYLYIFPEWWFFFNAEIKSCKTFLATIHSTDLAGSNCILSYLFSFAKFVFTLNICCLFSVSLPWCTAIESTCLCSLWYVGAVSTEKWIPTSKLNITFTFQIHRQRNFDFKIERLSL